MGRKIPGAALLAAAALAAALPCEAAYVRGDLVWKCDFTPEEAARCGVTGRLRERQRPSATSSPGLRSPHRSARFASYSPTTWMVLP